MDKRSDKPRQWDGYYNFVYANTLQSMFIDNSDSYSVRNLISKSIRDTEQLHMLSGECDDLGRWAIVSYMISYISLQD